MTKDPKKIFIKTYGCQMNVYDSEKMAEIMGPHGYSLTDVPDDADLVILNTCHIREKATEKVYSDLGRLKKHKDRIKKQSGKDQYIAVAGCVAQAEGKEIMERAKYVDMVFGPQTYHQLPEMITKLEQKVNKQIINTDFPIDSKFDFLAEEKESLEKTSPDKTSSDQVKYTSFVTIQEGCDKFCHFCCVPYTRGTEYSRPVAQILAECQKLADQGTVEITLLGQNVNAYHGVAEDGSIWGLGKLLTAIDKIKGIERLRYTTSHPRDVDQELIDAHANLPKLMPFLHLPVQSGSNKILKAMNRKHDRDMYFEVIEKLRAARPDLMFSSDFIVGYPGETDQDFLDTLDMVNRVGFAQAYSFKYSPRPGTPAATLVDQLSDEVKSQRLAALQQLLTAQQLAFNHQQIGKVLPVLVENKSKTAGKLFGRTPYLQSVTFVGHERLVGTICQVKIISGGANSLHGEIETIEMNEAA